VVVVVEVAVVLALLVFDGTAVVDAPVADGTAAIGVEATEVTAGRGPPQAMINSKIAKCRPRTGGG
jgi:hypothetical protein